MIKNDNPEIISIYSSPIYLDDPSEKEEQIASDIDERMIKILVETNALQKKKGLLKIDPKHKISFIDEDKRIFSNPYQKKPNTSKNS